MNRTRRPFLTIIVAASLAAFSMGAGAEPDLLSANDAFKLSARLVDGRIVELDYDIAPGYHLYRGHLAYTTDNPAVRVVSVKMPEPLTAFDQALSEKVAYYAGRITVRVALAGPNVPVRLTAKGQGCAVGRVCYPPFSRTFSVPAMGGAKG
ncbi:protein-disulfide reductase DsbD N-terminal domain-containing protein (plasmid) [Ralstonia pseudosolanacearum]